MRDTPGRRPPCLHERAFAGQRTANGIAVSCPRRRVDRIGECASPYPINGDEPKSGRARDLGDRLQSRNVPLDTSGDCSGDDTRI